MCGSVLKSCSGFKSDMLRPATATSPIIKMTYSDLTNQIMSVRSAASAVREDGKGGFGSYCLVYGSKSWPPKNECMYYNELEAQTDGFCNPGCIMLKSDPDNRYNVKTWGDCCKADPPAHCLTKAVRQNQ